MPPAPKPAEKPAPAESSYPNLEGFIERATADEVSQAFQQIKDGLATLKGPRAEQAKKVEVALERTRELLAYLLGVRDQLDEARKPGQKGRK